MQPEFPGFSARPHTEGRIGQPFASLYPSPVTSRSRVRRLTCVRNLGCTRGPAPSHNGNPTMPKKVYIETVGCQMNVLDSELVIGALRRQGYDLTDSPADADVLLFNTCSVREHAEDKTFSALGRVRPVKQRNPDVVI